jgi:hypothetical protein
MTSPAAPARRCYFQQALSVIVRNSFEVSLFPR